MGKLVYRLSRGLRFPVIGTNILSCYEVDYIIMDILFKNANSAPNFNKNGLQVLYSYRYRYRYCVLDRRKCAKLDFVSNRNTSYSSSNCQRPSKLKYVKKFTPA